MKRLRILATLLVLPMVLMACPNDDEGAAYEIPEEESSIMGPNASAPPSIQFDGPYVARIG